MDSIAQGDLLVRSRPFGSGLGGHVLTGRRAFFNEIEEVRKRLLREYVVVVVYLKEKCIPTQ
jgi:hypothetical protein